LAVLALTNTGIRLLPGAYCKTMSSLFDQKDFSVRIPSETVEMGDISGWPNQPDRMFIGPL